MFYGEILRNINKPMFSSEISYIRKEVIIYEINVQRSSPDGGVKLQANGRRKIQLLHKEG